MKKIIFISTCLLLCVILSCNTHSDSNNSISTDSVAIAAGEKIFDLNCSGCHNFKQDGIGPQLSGLTGKIPADWIRRFIKDPHALILSRDERALELTKKYPTPMPAFAQFGTDELNSLIAFINSHRAPSPQLEDKNTLSNPIPEPVQLSGLTLGLQFLAQIPASSDSEKTPLARITQIGFDHISHDLYVLDLRGKLYRLQQGKPVVYMDISKLEPHFISEPGLATGFGSFAFHPDFQKNGLLYTSHAEAAGSAQADFTYPDSVKITLQWVLTEWKTNNPRSAVFTGTGRELMRINMVSGIHGVQEIAFNPLTHKGDKDFGLLYLGVGDGGAVENGAAFLAHSKDKPWGTILRIDPASRNSRNGKYGIPVSNPFANEIYAYGFRNPHRFSWTASGMMIACNIGQANIEAIDLILPGRDYGWPIREGNFALNPYGDLTKVSRLPSNDSVYGVTYPIAEYDHDEGKAISGGFEYSGNDIPALKGKYLFGDIPTGRLFYVDMNKPSLGKTLTIKEWKLSLNGKIKSLKELCGSDRVDLHFGEDPQHELYILTKADGKIYKLMKNE